ncbi:MAG: anion permease [Streptococcaceae bacterium]|jgi:DASS family divalent anion:Na+ symporter|nr:anion permease [Streptococcaceae bacterium]
MKNLGVIHYRKFTVPLILGIGIWLATPVRPDGLSMAAWHMLAVFIATIAALITEPLPIGAVAFLGFTFSIVTGTVPVDAAVAGFGNPSIWLIALAFFLSRGFIKTGLGRRIALVIVGRFGKKTIGLVYSIIGVDLILAPATPSNTARAGGVIYPIVESISKALGSDPANKTERKIGSFLMFSEYQGNVITSGMFMTAMAGNPLVYNFAVKAGIHLTWTSWFLAALVPGLVSLILFPLVLFKIYPPELKETPNAKKWADDELKAQGPTTRAEKIMLGTFALALFLWVIASSIGLNATTVGFIAIAILLVTGVLSWTDILKETGAWNTLFWFSVLVMMAGELAKFGFIAWLSKGVDHYLHGMNWFVILVILVLVYFYLHYLFASEVAHITALFPATLALAVAGGVPPLLAASMLAIAGNLVGSTTHYASGPAPIYFGSGYIKQRDWWKNSFILGVMYLAILLSVGTLWMKIIGIW